MDHMKLTILLWAALSIMAHPSDLKCPYRILS
jgi:hypothetical protein